MFGIGLGDVRWGDVGGGVVSGDEGRVCWTSFVICEESARHARVGVQIQNILHYRSLTPLPPPPRRRRAAAMYPAATVRL